MTGARTTLRVAATPSGSVGFRQRQSHLVVNVEHCLVAHPSLNALLPTTHLEGAQEAVVRVGVSSAERLAWAEPADSLSGLPVDVRLGSQAIVHEVVAGHIFQISASSFFQSSPQAAEALVDTTRRASVIRPSGLPVQLLTPTAVLDFLQPQCFRVIAISLPLNQIPRPARMRV